jgi:hypothetical protein
MDGMQPAGLKPLANRSVAEPELEQLPAGDHTMLPTRQPPGGLSTRWLDG